MKYMLLKSHQSIFDGSAPLKAPVAADPKIDQFHGTGGLLGGG